MTRLSRLGRALVMVALAVALGLASELAAHGTHLTVQADLDLLTGLALAGSGALAFIRVPGSRIGLLLWAAGVAWFIGTVADPGSDLGRMAAALTFVYAGPLVQALLTFPSGRVARPIEVIGVTGGWVASLLPPAWGWDGGLFVLGVLLAAGSVACARVLPAASRNARTPALALGLALGSMLAVKASLAAALNGAHIAFLGTPEVLWEIALILVALLLTRALLALERRRASITDLVVELDERGAGGEAISLAEIDADPSLRDALARAREMTIRNAELRAALAAQLEELTASRRRTLEAADDERLALEERLQAGAARRLDELTTVLAPLERSMAARVPESRPHLDRAIDQLSRTRAELVDLARGLGPGVLRDHGLAAALRELAQLSPVPVEVRIDLDSPAPRRVDTTLYFAGSEGLANVARHAHAARVWLRLTGDDQSVALVVEDDGVGGADPRGGGGLRGLQDRLEAVGGTLVVGPRSGGGSRLTARVPVRAQVRRISKGTMGTSAAEAAQS